MRPTARLAMTAYLVTALALTVGCGAKKDPNAPLLPSATPPIEDVPVPAGFSMTGESTSKVEGTGLRFVDHKYEGGDDFLPVVRFYKDHMPEKGWQFVDQNQLPHNEISLHYSKNSEDCTITVTPGSMHTHIRVKIDPTGRNIAR